MQKLLLFILLFFVQQAKGQQLPLFFHHFYKPFLINPAQTGANKYTEAFLSLNRQWIGWNDAPESAFLSLDGSLYKERMGIGLTFFYDRTGIFKQTGGMFSYAYTIPFTGQHVLKLGLSLGYNSLTLDLNPNQLSPVDLEDEVLLAYQARPSHFDGNLGISYRFRSFRLGFAAHQLLSKSLYLKNDPNGRDIWLKLIRHYYLTADWEYNLNYHWKLKPRLLLQSAQGLPVHYQLMATCWYQDNWWVGLSYRGSVSAGIVTGIQLDKKVRLSYAFELPFRENTLQSLGSHELTLSLRLDGLFTKNSVSNTEKSSTKKLKKTPRSQAQIALFLGALQDVTAIDGYVADYFIVLAAFNKLKHAKAHSKNLRRRTGIKTAVVESEEKEGETFYLLYSKRYGSYEKAQAQLGRWHGRNFHGMVPGKPWIYRKRRGL